MSAWTIACLALCGVFGVCAMVFALLKDKGAHLISGFSTLSKEKKELYDKKQMSADLRNDFLIWSGILFAGAILSYFASFYFALAAILLWLVLFFRKVSWNTEKAFQKYKIKK